MAGMVSVARRGRPSLVMSRGSSVGALVAAGGDGEGSGVAEAVAAADGAAGGADGVAVVRLDTSASRSPLVEPLQPDTNSNVAATAAAPGRDRWRAMPSTVRRYDVPPLTVRAGRLRRARRVV